MAQNKPSDKNLNSTIILKRITWPMGVWPFSNNVFSSFRLLIAVLSQIWMVICVTMEITLGCSNVDEVIDLILAQQYGIVGILKMLLLRYYRKNVYQIITSINEDWLSIKDSKYLTIMRSFASFGHFIVKAQLIFVVIQIFLMGFSHLILSVQSQRAISNSSDIFLEPSFPLNTKCLFKNVSTKSYILIFTLQMIQIIYSSLATLWIDIFLFLLAMHIGGQLEILYEGFCNVNGQNNFVEVKEQIVTLSQRHEYLLNKSMILEKSFNLIIMSQLAVYISSISLYALQMILNSRESGFSAAIKPISAIQLILIQVFLCCYAGDLVSSKVIAIACGLYDSLWYKIPISLSKYIFFIMMRAGKPFKLTAGKLFLVNLNTFSRILKVCFSYFSVMRLMLYVRYSSKE